MVGPIALAAAPLHAQVIRPSDGYTVRGSVFDSIGLAVLPNAVVQLARLAGADSAPQVRTVVADGVGLYRVTGLPAGRYASGFQHELLEMFAIEAPLPEDFRACLDAAGLEAPDA